MAYFPTKVLDNQIKALPTVSTASGSVANFTTDKTENLVEVECEIIYQQQSGTPSPSSPLPITTYASLNLSHSGSDTSNPNVTNIPFGQTVAKGKLNVTTGKLEITHGVVDIGSLGWTYQSAQIRFYVVFPNAKAPINNQTKADIVCENYETVAFDNFVGANTMVALTTSNSLFIRDNAYTDATTFKTAVSGVKLVYELATPTIVQLSAQTITALLNENNIWCDTGDTSVKFILSVGEYVNQNT